MPLIPQERAQWHRPRKRVYRINSYRVHENRRNTVTLSNALCYHNSMSLLTFQDHFVHRVWGGNTLADRYDKALPDEVIGEAWLISDHHSHSSVVNRGPHEGRSLQELLKTESGILGTRCELTRHGRFPLLLKILDCNDKLSVQVHPDDEHAYHLEEQDVGKTESWHLLDATDGAELFCGLPRAYSENDIRAAIREDNFADVLNRFPAKPNATVFVEAGTVHAIGEGCLIAEIQRNSDLTYRMSDWGRRDAKGNRRELHIEKALRVINRPNVHDGYEPSLQYPAADALITVHCACKYFATEELTVQGSYTEARRGSTPHIFLSKGGDLTIGVEGDTVAISPGEAALVTADEEAISVSGTGTALMYYVPDVDVDIVEPLLQAGHPIADIQKLLH